MAFNPSARPIGGSLPNPSTLDVFAGSTTYPFPGSALGTNQPATATVIDPPSTGTAVPFVVPPGVTSMRVECWAAAGTTAGSGSDDFATGGQGGLGGYASAIIPVSPGDTLYAVFNNDAGPATITDIYGFQYAYILAGSGTTGGDNPGGAVAGPYQPDATGTSYYVAGAQYGQKGGGSVDVRLGANDPALRQVVAGGGGGGGGNGSNATSDTSDFLSGMPQGGAGGPGGDPNSAGGLGENNGAGSVTVGSAGVVGNPTASGIDDASGAAIGGGGATGQTPGAAGTNAPNVTAAAPTAGGAPTGAFPAVGGQGGASSNAGWPGGSGGAGGGGYLPGAAGGAGGGDFFSGQNWAAMLALIATSSGVDAADLAALIASEIGQPAVSSGAAGGGGAGGSNYVNPQATGVRMRYGVWANPTGGQVMLTPNPPVCSNLTLPGTVFDAAAGFTLIWDYFSQSNTPQIYVAVERQALGGLTHQWWSGAVWEDYECFCPYQSGGYIFSPGLWENGASWLVSVCPIDNNLAVGAYSPAMVFSAQDNPTLELPVIPVALTAQTVSFAWSSTGDSPTNYGVDLVNPAATAAQAVFDSYGQPLQWSIPDYLPNGDYTATVVATQPDGRTVSGSLAFVVNAALPTAPTLTVTGSDPADVPAVILQAELPAGGLLIAERSLDGGATWVPVRSQAQVAAGGTAYLVDAEATPLTSVLHRVAVQTETAQSEWTTATAPVTLTPTRFTFSDPLTPGSAIQVSMQRGKLTQTRGERQAAFDLLSISTPIVLSDGLQAPSLALAFNFVDYSEYLAFLDLSDSCTTLLFQSATWAQQWYVRLGPSATDDFDFLSAREYGTPVTAVVTTAQVVAAPTGAVITDGSAPVAADTFDSGGTFDDLVSFDS
jgi:methionine-rich copper-binding protein CopC